MVSSILSNTKSFISSSSSSSSCPAASTDLPDPHLLSISIIHCSQEVFKAISCIRTELLYIGSSWSSCLCSSMWRGPQEYVVYEFVLTSPAVSHMSGSSNLDSFLWWVLGGHTSAVLWGVASRTYSILFTAFLCNCRQTFSPCILLASI